MKNANLFLLVVLLCLRARADVSESRKAGDETAKVRWAIQVLIDAGALKYDEQQDSLKLSTSVVDDLRRRGLIKKKNSEMAAICPDGGGW